CTAPNPCSAANWRDGWVRSFPDTERRKNSIQNIVRRGGAGNRIDRPQGRVKIQQQHLVRDAELDRIASLRERLQRLPQQLFMPDAGDESGLLPGDAR